ncbi:hypothetical protein BDV38DRAFT_247169 [Aspergillus pseudotamarii]|uniref:Uncharacterized protein n=1 Tax=Aspergillus pseudotamarii TaxID=132259 RepID=A0A5N6SRP0_ASPPS|nr:uncharacterized protein BDV38DRAFT_247169 [Aspergillus pseudotamarii]KAE8137356.1 hypothetical protein BDV38DRAFT_247169 [Aspergillus pseudotamarii]
MKYMVDWHPEYRVPIVDGRFRNPNTGEIEEAGEIPCYSGPPSVHTLWVNLELESNFRMCGADFCATIDEVLLAIAEHVKQKAYTIESINGSPYSMTVVCRTSKSQGEMCEYFNQMHRDLGRDVWVSPEDEAKFRSFVEEEQMKDNPRF